MKYNDVVYGDINYNLEFVCCFLWLLIDLLMVEDICVLVFLSMYDSVVCNDSIEFIFF